MKQNIWINYKFYAYQMQEKAMSLDDILPNFNHNCVAIATSNRVF